MPVFVPEDVLRGSFRKHSSTERWRIRIDGAAVVGSMHERKALMAELSDAFMALPGGYGTWDELFEALTWSQLGIQSKACGLLNVDGYYDAMIAMVDRAISQGFVHTAHRALLHADTDVARLLERLNHAFVSAIRMAAVPH